jgi:hypothetical protein
VRNQPLKGGPALTAYSTVDERDSGVMKTFGLLVPAGISASGVSIRNSNNFAIPKNSHRDFGRFDHSTT